MYDLTRLSPLDFEDLARDLLQAEWGVRLETFKSGRDAGIDLRYSCPLEGHTVIQCKHYAGSGFATLLRHLGRDEASKIARLSPTRYVLVTSVPLSPGNKASIRQTLSPHVISDMDVISATDIENLLRRHQKVETDTPKLWFTSVPVLRRVLHNAERLQTELSVDGILEKLRLYVSNAAYPRALEILERERAVVVSGVPGVGKTTLADMLLLEHLEKGFEPIKIRYMAEARRLFTKERKQIFYFDDFLGETLLSPRSDLVGRREDEEILEFIRLAGRTPSVRFILTTREHLLKQAVQSSERFGRERSLLGLRRCILDMGDYSLVERGRILFNHIYFGNLQPEHRTALLREEFYLAILRHRNFNPRLVEWLSQLQNVEHVPPGDFPALVTSILEHPSLLWQHAFEHQVSESGRSLLIALYAGGATASLDDLRRAWDALHRHRAARHNFRTSAEDWCNALRELEGGFLAFKEGRVRFVNPSLRDFFDGMIPDYPDHAVELLASAQAFRVVAGVWKLALSEKGASLLNFLRCSPSILEDAVRRTVFSEEDGKIGLHFVPLQLSTALQPEVRLLTVVQLASSLKSNALQIVALDLLHRITAGWATAYPDHESMLAVIEDMEDDVSFWSPTAANLKRRIIGEITRDSYRMDSFHAFASYARSKLERLDNIETMRLRNAFRTYLRESFSDEIDSLTDESHLDLISSQLDSIGLWLGVRVASKQATITSRIDTLRDSPEADHSGPTPAWKALSPSRDTAEDEVRRMFDVLRPG